MFLFAVTPIFFTTVVQAVYYRDRFAEVDDVEGLAAAATEHLELLEQKDKAEGSFIIEKIVGKLLTHPPIKTKCGHITLRGGKGEEAGENEIDRLKI